MNDRGLIASPLARLLKLGGLVGRVGASVARHASRSASGPRSVSPPATAFRNQPCGGQGDPGGSPLQVLPNGAENRYLKVEINADGSLNLLDKSTGRKFRDLGYFEDTEDAGDEYDYSPAPVSETIASLGGTARCRLVHAGPLQVTYEVSLQLSLPSALTADRQRRRAGRLRCHPGREQVDGVTGEAAAASSAMRRNLFPSLMLSR